MNDYGVGSFLAGFFGGAALTALGFLIHDGLRENRKRTPDDIPDALASALDQEFAAREAEISEQQANASRHSRRLQVNDPVTPEEAASLFLRYGGVGRDVAELLRSSPSDAQLAAAMAQCLARGVPETAVLAASSFFRVFQEGEQQENESRHSRRVDLTMGDVFEGLEGGEKANVSRHSRRVAWPSEPETTEHNGVRLTAYRRQK